MLCRVCDSSDLEVAINLGRQPFAHLFLQPDEVGKECSYPLEVSYCHQCQTAQLASSIKKEAVYADHTYLSGVTKTLCSHFDHLARQVDARFFKEKKHKRALDIGSNDGAQLTSYKEIGYEILGVEAAQRIADVANQNGIDTLATFFNLETAKSIGSLFDVINASGVFFHLEELHSVTEGIRLLLKPDGVFVVQFLYMKKIQDNGAFDQIYHEHLLYYTLATVDKLLARHGLALFDAHISPIHGGSVIGFATHANKRPPSHALLKLKKQEGASGCNSFGAYRSLEKKVALLKEGNLNYLNQKRKEGKSVFGMGAPVKGNTLLNTFGISKDYISCLVEKNRFRKNLFSPGMHLPIVLEDELSAPPDVYYVLAWNFRDEILKNNASLIKKGVEFYFPIVP